MSQVAKYYDHSSKYYLLFYADQESLGLHYGFWDKNTKTRKQALLNQYRQANELLQIKPNERVLDAGCGVGGASLWLAKNTEGKFDGITLSAEQVELARKFSAERNLTDRVTFHQMDFNKTSFKNESFDKAFGIESFCYSYPDQLILFKEMYRLLKKGGRLVMSDGLLYRHPNNDTEKKWLKNFKRGWHVKTLSTIEEITEALKQAGFNDVHFIDKTKEVAKSSRQIFWIGLYAYPITKIMQLLGIVSHLVPDNIYAGLAQRKIFGSDLGGYGIFHCTK